MDVSKFLGKIAEQRYNKTTFCKAVGISYPTFNRKLQGGAESFTIGEAITMGKVLGCTDDELKDIFLSSKS